MVIYYYCIGARIGHGRKLCPKFSFIQDNS